MLKISEQEIGKYFDKKDYRSFDNVINPYGARALAYWLLGAFAGFILVLFLPWTQNIRARGNVTSLHPEQRPQTIHATISGRIEQWYVSEGDLVQKGDTIVFLSEVKAEYFDPDLIERMKKQISAKESAIGSYSNKIEALERQNTALREQMKFKLSQARNKLTQARSKLLSDSAEYVAAIANLQIADSQLVMAENLYDQGIYARTELQKYQSKFQEKQAKRVSTENKYLIAANNLVNAQIELSSLRAQYSDKISKNESDKFSAMSALFDTEALVSKMKVQLANYSIRSGFYHITAPQDCYITKAIKTGIGEIIKEGTPVVSMMPLYHELAVELYIKPMDLPLIYRYDKVRLIFDGWPSLVFSGWPDASFGTFGGKVQAIDNMISTNGKYRILISPDENEEPWPRQLRIGSGADGMALLNDVPIWYELWRQLNGFPPEFYQPKVPEKKGLKATKYK